MVAGVVSGGAAIGAVVIKHGEKVVEFLKPPDCYRCGPRRKVTISPNF